MNWGPASRTVPAREAGSFKTLVVGLDCTPSSEKSIPWARWLAPEARLTLVHSVAWGGLSDPYADALALGSIRDQGEEYLGKLASTLAPRPQALVRFGTPASVLRTVARERGCGLIAIATHGGSAVRRRLLGRTTERLLHVSEFPVLVVPSWIEDAPVGGSDAAIGVPLDGSGAAELILPLAMRLARERRVRLVLIENSDAGSAESPDAHPSSTETVLSILREGSLEPDVVAARKPGVEGIVGAAEDVGLSLLAMSVPGHGTIRHLVSGGLPSELLQRSPIPVLVARHDSPFLDEPPLETGRSHGLVGSHSR